MPTSEKQNEILISLYYGGPLVPRTFSSHLFAANFCLWFLQIGRKRKLAVNVNIIPTFASNVTTYLVDSNSFCLLLISCYVCLYDSYLAKGESPLVPCQSLQKGGSPVTR